MEAPLRIHATINGSRFSVPGTRRWLIGGWEEQPSERTTAYVRADAVEGLLEALRRYGFPVSDAASRALVDGGSREAKALHAAAFELHAALAKAGA